MIYAVTAGRCAVRPEQPISNGTSPQRRPVVSTRHIAFTTVQWLVPAGAARYAELLRRKVEFELAHDFRRDTNACHDRVSRVSDETPLKSRRRKSMSIRFCQTF
jgi:hypothetical protein